MSAQETSAGPKDLQFEIAHILLFDAVGYSKLLVNEQIELLQQLNQIVRATNTFRQAEANGKLIRLPTGDGMALLFFRSPEEPVRCALEISEALKDHPNVRIRMGVHSGPVNEITDVNDRSNIAGAGINVAQRVMDCGDAGHILLSKHLADDLDQYRHWQPFLHDLGECEVKHGMRLHIVNLYKDGLGNPQLPGKLQRGRRWRSESGASARPFRPSDWPHLVIVAALCLSALAVVLSSLIFFYRGFRPWSENPSRDLVSAAVAIPAKSIAVLPFDNLSDDKQNSYLADGVQDEVLTDLAKVADFKVISRTSVMQYRNSSQRNLGEIAKALGVALVVEGSVQRSGDRVKVSAQLIDARTDTHVWAERYERDLIDVFAIQSEVAEKIVSQLKTKLSPQVKAAIEEQPTHDLQAYELYVRAMNLMTTSVYARGTENRLEAVRLLDEAVTRDPAFFRAYCQLANVHDQIYLLGMDHTRARLALADAALQAARHLRPAAGEIHLATAYHLYGGYLDYRQANDELAVARHLLPNEPRVFEFGGYIDRRQGRREESLANFKRAVELDPRNFFVLEQFAISYRGLRRFAEEREVLDRALQVVPTDPGARLRRAQIELDWHANTKPLHDTLQTILAENPADAAALAYQWFFLALYERDGAAARRALASMSTQGDIVDRGFHYPKSWIAGVIARAFGDNRGARAAFVVARVEVEKEVRAQPDYAQPLSLLGMIDAGLDRKEDAIREGRRAIELLPVSKDMVTGAVLMENLAIIYAWTGEREQACNQLVALLAMPADVSYGDLCLYPLWDPLRGYPRFEKIVASLAPKKP